MIWLIAYGFVGIVGWLILGGAGPDGGVFMSRYDAKSGCVPCRIYDETGKLRALVASIAAAKRMCKENRGWYIGFFGNQR